MSDTKFRIYVLQDSTYIMGEVVQENIIKNALMVILMEDNIVHFQTFDIFNRHAQIEINNYITFYEPSDDLIKEYERIIEESKKENEQKELDEKIKDNNSSNVLNLFNNKWGTDNDDK